jgi:hypothetical protein
MTQLNLSNRQSTTKQESPRAEENEGSIKNQTVGAFGALVVFAAVIAIGSCSRGNNKPAVVAQTTQPSAPISNPIAQATVPVPAPEPVKAKPRKRRPATLSYVNREYGVSFSFPRQYMLKSGDEAQLSWGDLGPFLMDFVHPGGVTLAAVELPGNSYPGTDFKSGFVNVSVNPGMTSEACTQFAFPEPKAGVEPSSPDTTGKDATGKDTAGKDTTAKVKIGAIEFSEVDNSTAATMKQTDAKYYHAFNNGACYEFALGIGTESDGSVEGITPVDRQAVFGKLEKILATVKLQPAAAPETETPAPSAKEAAPDASSTTQEQSAIDRKF